MEGRKAKGEQEPLRLHQTVLSHSERGMETERTICDECLGEG